VEVVQIDDVGYQALMSDLFTQALKLMLPRLLRNVLGSLPLPEFDLSALAEDGVLPAGTVWRLRNAAMTFPEDEYLLFTGNLE